VRLQSDEQLKTPGNEEISMYRRIVELKEQEDTAKPERERLECKLKISIGTSAGLEEIATWKTESRPELDRTALKAARPDIYREFLRDVQLRKFYLK
jgi:hypothetical protein